MIKKLKAAFKSPSFWQMITNVLLGVLVICLSARTVYPKDTPHWIPVAVPVLLYLLLTAIAALIFFLVGKLIRKDDFAGVKPALSGIALDFMTKLEMPVLICEEDTGIVRWYNSTFLSVAKRKGTPTGMTVEALTGYSAESLLSDCGVYVRLFDRGFDIRGYRVSSAKKNYILTLWDDNTVLHDSVEQMRSEETLVALILLDNIDELLQNSQEESAGASIDKAEGLLRAWAVEAGGILRETDRDKFLFLFPRKSLSAMIESRFGILDSVREIRIASSGLPITASIGVCGMTGTLEEKIGIASDSLELALQRGGDQVVLRDEAGGTGFFGGKTITTQKRNKVHARMTALKLIERLSGASNVLVMMHRGPDFDAIGAAFSMTRLCTFCGVRVNVIVNTEDPNFLLCYDKVKEIPEYQDGSLFVSAVEAQDMIGPETLLAVVDVNSVSQFESPEIYDMLSTRTVIIDHHRKTAEFPDKPLEEYIEPAASSSCELMAEILELTVGKGLLRKEEADIMYAGITLDTKQFVHNTGTRTFESALYLRGEGALPVDVQTLFRSSLQEFRSEVRFESNIKIYRGIFAISYNDYDGNTKKDAISAAKAADKLLTVAGIEASFALCRVDDTIHISARSAGKINVQILMSKMGGGGHFDASATRMAGMTMTEAMEQLKNAIDEYVAENDH